MTVRHSQHRKLAADAATERHDRERSWQHLLLADRWQRSHSAVGRFRSGSSDQVGVDHDRYLEAIYRI
jgi:hypothetical protein